MIYFTVNAYDNGYYDYENKRFTNPKLNFCFQSWKKYNPIIYDFNHPWVKEAKEIYKDYINICMSIEKNYEKNYKYVADVIRLYIMSKLNEPSVYFDTDVYCKLKREEDLPIEKGFYTGGNGCFNILFCNGGEEVVKRILKIYEICERCIDDYKVVDIVSKILPDNLKIDNANFRITLPKDKAKQLVYVREKSDYYKFISSLRETIRVYSGDLKTFLHSFVFFTDIKGLQEEKIGAKTTHFTPDEVENIKLIFKENIWEY